MIPNLKFPPEESAIRLGKWDMLHKDYLEKHNPVLFATFLTQGKLYQHCAEVENQAREMFDTLVEQMIKTEGIIEKLKADNQIEWTGKMMNIEARAREILYFQLIYV